MFNRAHVVATWFWSVDADNILFLSATVLKASPLPYRLNCRAGVYYLGRTPAFKLVQVKKSSQDSFRQVIWILLFHSQTLTVLKT